MIDERLVAELQAVFAAGLSQVSLRFLGFGFGGIFRPNI
jgi:hypothetical protein